MIKKTLIPLTLILLSGCTDYVAMDLAKEKINCDELTELNHHTSRYIYDKELKGEHKFLQCREEINNQHKDRCDRYFDGFFEQNAWYGGKEGKLREEHNNKVCNSIIIKNISNLKNEYEIKGDALIINGLVFNKNGLVLKNINKKNDLGVDYFKVIVVQGGEIGVLRYLNEFEAKKTYENLVDFISDLN